MIKKETLYKAASKAHKKTIVPVIDLVLGRTISKKLLVFFIACWFLFRHFLDGDQWIEIAKIYIGAQAVVDTSLAIMGKKNEHKKNIGYEEETH